METEERINIDTLVLTVMFNNTEVDLREGFKVVIDKALDQGFSIPEVADCLKEAFRRQAGKKYVNCFKVEDIENVDMEFIVRGLAE